MTKPFDLLWLYGKKRNIKTWLRLSNNDICRDSLMKKVKIRLNGISNIAEFVSIMEKLSVNADLGQGSVHIDARSMIGVLAMDTTKPIVLSINEAEEKAECIIRSIDSYLVN